MTDPTELHRLCDSEPIHRPGAIQPHGALLLLDASGRIAAASANLRAVVGAHPRSVLGARLDDALGTAAADACLHALADVDAHRSVTGRAAFESGGRRIEVGAIRQDGHVVLDLEMHVADADAGGLVRGAVSELSTIRLIEEPAHKAAACCRLVRRLTGFERVMVYRLHDDAHGEVIAEDRRDDLEPFLGLHYPAGDIPPQARRLYLDNRVRAIPDANYAPVTLVGDPQAVSADIGRSALRSVSPYHLAYLRNMGVQATLVGSLVVDGRLWGLVACHHVSAPHACAPSTRDVFEWICDDLAQQIALVEGTRSGAYAMRLERMRDALIGAVRDGGIEAMAAVQCADAVLGAAGADGFALVRPSDVRTIGRTPPRDVVERIAAELGPLASHEPGRPPLALQSLAERLPWAADFADCAAGALAVELPGPSAVRMLWFRGEQAMHVRWAGNPDRTLEAADDGALGPRRSFAEWLKIVSHRSQPWLEMERAGVAALVDALQIELGSRAKQALHLLEQAVARVNDVILITEASPLDAPGPRIVYANEAFERATGYSVAEAIGRSPRFLQGPETSRPELDRCRAALERREPVSLELVNYHRDGTPYWNEIDIVPLTDGSGACTHFISVQRDATQRKHVQQALVRSERRLQSLLAQLDEVVLVVDRSGQVLMASTSWLDALGPRPDRIEGERLPKLLAPLTRGRTDDGLGIVWPMLYDPVDPMVVHVALGGDADPDAQDDEVWIRLGAERFEDEDLPGRPCAVVVLRDVTERRRFERTLMRQARTDALTGLGNRLALVEQARRWFDAGVPCALALLDLDDFKSVNDTYGHSVGDQAIQRIARRLGALEPSDDAFIARLGGDELAVLLRMDGTGSGLHGRLANYLAAVGDPVPIGALELELRACAGYACFPQDGGDFETLLRRADLALYDAKAAGSGRLSVYVDDLERAISERARLHSRLGKALDLGQLVLHYQPIVRMADRQVQGFEALCRWRQDDGTLLTPDRFIPHAEATGLIDRIDRWVLQQAADAVRVLDANGLRAATLSINLSAMQLRRDKGLVATLAGLKARLPGIERRIVLEITESAAIDDRGEALETVEAGRRLGFRFSLDDFGTGYASLAYLHRLGASVVKIDRSFVRGLPDEAQASTIVRAVINLGHDLGFDVVAEGVETEAQAVALAAMGCDAFQGWLFSRAMPLPDAIALAHDSARVRPAA